MTKCQMSKIRIEASIDDEPWIWEAYYGGEYAGQLACVPQENGNLLFSDVVISDGTQSMPMLPWWKRLLGVKNKAPDFRNKKIGTELTRTMLEAAKNKQIKRIYGSIVQKDIDESPHLLDWYEKMGFRICEPDDDCLGNAVKKIEMVL